MKNQEVALVYECKKSPTGNHCWHDTEDGWIYPSSNDLVCCHCGKTKKAHGPFMPTKTGPIVRFDAEEK